MESIILVKKSPENELTSRISKEIELPEVVLNLLINRGYKSKEEIVTFLRPDFKNLFDPFLMHDMEKAADRVLSAIAEKEKITLYGDYDVDGVSGVSLLYRILNRLGGDASFYIPHRIEEGYGLSEKGVRYAHEIGTNLLITIDCGITDFEEIELANSLGMDVVVVDHHETTETLPHSFATLNPKKNIDAYPFKELSGVGVAFKLAQALCEKKGLSKDVLEEHLDLVALGTMADVVPLVSENRIFAKLGMERIEQSRKQGIISLLEVAGLKGKRLNTYDVTYGLAPRLNAKGRMSHARPSVEILITEDKDNARKLAESLNAENKERQEIEKKTLEDAISVIKKEIDLNKEKVIVLAQEDWHEGVIGICASKIVEKYYRPAMLIALKGEIGKGSARSIPPLHLYNALKKCGEYLVSFGGHAQAAGLNVNRNKIEEFRAAMNETVENLLNEDDLKPKVVADCHIDFEAIDEKLVEILKYFAPYGPSNPTPLFLTEGVDAVGSPSIVGNGHLKIKLRQKGKVMSCIGFGLGDFLSKIEIATPNLKILFTIDKDEFMGKKKITLKIREIRLLGASGFEPPTSPTPKERANLAAPRPE